MDVTLHFEDVDWQHVVGYCAERLAVPVPQTADEQATAVAAVLEADGLAGALSFYSAHTEPPASPLRGSLEAAHARWAAIQEAATTPAG